MHYIPKHNPYYGGVYGKSYDQLLKEDIAKFKEDPNRGTDPTAVIKDDYGGLRDKKYVKIRALKKLHETSRD